MTILAVRYQPDSSSDPVIEQVQDEEQQAALVAFMILDLGRPTAEPVTLIPQPDTALLAKIRRDIAEQTVIDYATCEITDNQAFDRLAQLAPALHDTEGGETFSLLEHAADAHRDWTGLDGRCLSEFEPEMRDWDLLDKRFRALLDEALDDLMRALDACTSQQAGEHTETKGAAA